MLRLCLDFSCTNLIDFYLNFLIWEVLQLEAQINKKSFSPQLLHALVQHYNCTTSKLKFSPKNQVQWFCQEVAEVLCQLFVRYLLLFWLLRNYYFMHTTWHIHTKSLQYMNQESILFLKVVKLLQLFLRLQHQEEFSI